MGPLKADEVGLVGFDLGNRAAHGAAREKERRLKADEIGLVVV